MRSRRHASALTNGYTIIELAVVIAIISVLAVIGGSYMMRSKPRADLANAALELQVLFHQARQSALAAGVPVGVLVYPNYSPPAASGEAASTGYVIIYQDACFDFFTGGGTCGVAYGSYNPAVLTTGGASAILDTMTLPYGIIVGPATGMGSSATLTAPLQNVHVNVACDFCGSTGGAIQFDTTGQATFYKLDGTSMSSYFPSGGSSLSLGYSAAGSDATGQRTLIILSGSGAVEVINGG